MAVTPLVLVLMHAMLIPANANACPELLDLHVTNAYHITMVSPNKVAKLVSVISMDQCSHNATGNMENVNVCLWLTEENVIAVRRVTGISIPARDAKGVPVIQWVLMGGIVTM